MIKLFLDCESVDCDYDTTEYPIAVLGVFRGWLVKEKKEINSIAIAKFSYLILT